MTRFRRGCTFLSPLGFNLFVWDTWTRIVKGFLHGLHASPFHGFSVEFSEHRKYTPGDDPKAFFNANTLDELRSLESD